MSVGKLHKACRKMTVAIWTFGCEFRSVSSDTWALWFWAWGLECRVWDSGFKF